MLSSVDLPDAGRAHDRDELAVGDLDVEVAQHVQAVRPDPVVLVDLRQAQHELAAETSAMATNPRAATACDTQDAGQDSAASASSTVGDRRRRERRKLAVGRRASSHAGA